MTGKGGCCHRRRLQWTCWKKCRGLSETDGNFGLAVNNKESGSVLKRKDFCQSLENTLFSKRENHLVDSPKAQVDYFFVWSDQKKFAKDLKVVSHEECITQHKPLDCDFKTKKVKDNTKKFVPRRKI